MQLPFNLTKAELACFDALLRGWADSPLALQMRHYIQHGSVSTYEHCLRVAQISFWLNRRLDLRADEISLVRGAMLHDFYLYDWHAKHPSPSGFFGMHGFTHPTAALKNAEAAFPLNDIERDIIISHMWPLTLRRPPQTAEGRIVCLADKICSTSETVLERRSSRRDAAEEYRQRQAHRRCVRDAKKATAAPRHTQHATKPE